MQSELGFPKGVRADLTDQFEGKTFEIKKPRALCAPADKDGEDPGAVTRSGHLQGHLIKESRRCSDDGRPCNTKRECSEGASCGRAEKHGKTLALVSNQLGTHVVETVKPK